MSVLILGHAHMDELAFRTNRIFGPRVYTIDSQEVQGISNAAMDARTRHTVLDLDDTPAL
jgi:hypothetical protein